MKVEFSYRKMAPEDAYSIMKTQWGPGAAEFERIDAMMKRDHQTPEALAEKFIKMSEPYGFAFLADGEMVAICGAEVGEKACYTWFMATPDLAKIGGDFTMWLRKFTKQKVAEEGVRLEMYSASLHENSDRWFAALGFQRGPGDVGIFRHYVYARKNKLTASA